MRRQLAAVMILGTLWHVNGRASPLQSDPGAAPVPSEQEAVFGPSTFERGRGAPAVATSGFAAQPGTDYTLLVEDLGPRGALAQVWLNGEALVTERDLGGDDRTTLTTTVTLLEQNELKVLLAGKPGSRVRVTVFGAVRSAAREEPCDARAALFTTPVVSPDGLKAVVPLGALRPPAQTLPTAYVSLIAGPDLLGAPSEVPVHAPGRATLVAVERRTVGSNVDFSLHLRPCREVRASLLHLARLAPELEAAIDGAGERYCLDPDTCVDAVAIEVAAGTLLGHGGGAGREPVGFAVEDDRQILQFANPERYTFAATPTVSSVGLPSDLASEVLPNRSSAMCGLDYFDPGVRAGFEALLGSPDGTRSRSAEPVCGEHMQDVPGTAQGNWFSGPADQALLDESTALALVHDNVDPGVGVFSVATVPRWGADTYVFTPATGYVNTDFDLVTPGAVYCYQGLRGKYGSLGGSVLLEVFSEVPGVANRLRVEHRGFTTCSGSRTFSWNAQVLQR